MELTAESLKKVVEQDAAIRRVQRLQPSGGKGDKIFPPTYPGEGNRDSPRHAFEMRRIEGKDIRCVLLDSVQSQANRLEYALLEAMKAGVIALPHIAVDFSGAKVNLSFDGNGKGAKPNFNSGKEYNLSDLGVITSLDAPHRIFDAIIRDSLKDGKPFTDTDDYRQLVLAKPTNALQVFKLSPTSLVFGAWNSHSEGGGLGARFSRCVVSEIVGIGATDGLKTTSRIDPLGVKASVKVVGDAMNWSIAKGLEGEKTKKPSEVGHSNIRPEVVSGGVTIDHALHTVVISCAGLRRLRFPGTKDEAAGRVVLAALALTAVTQQDTRGYALRSRCDLSPEKESQFEIVKVNGDVESVEIDADSALHLLRETTSKSMEAGFPWDKEPLRLTPQERLVQLVALSRAKAFEGEEEEPKASV